MINTKAFRQGPEFTGWLRAPSAERFVKDLDEQASQAETALMGACAMSTDPQVREALGRWITLWDLKEFLRKSRKEGTADDDE